MPTPNFAHDNTPPGGVPRGDQTPANGAPNGVTLASHVFDNTQPGAVPVATGAPGNGAPTAIARPSQEQTGVAPGQVAVATPEPANGAPTAIARVDQTPQNGAPDGVAVSTAAHNNAAPGAIPRPDQTPGNVDAGAVPVANTAGTASTPQPIALVPSIPALSDENMHTATLSAVGNLAVNQVFGFYKAPAAAVVKGVQLAAQKAPAGADVIVSLVDADGIALGRTATLPAGQAFAEVTFGTPLPLLTAAVVRAKVTQIGTGNTPGAYLTANLVVQLTA